MYQHYSASLKFSAVQVALNGATLAEISRMYAAEISVDLLQQWSSLYERTRSVVCNPKTYLEQGRPLTLNDEE